MILTQFQEVKNVLQSSFRVSLVVLGSQEEESVTWYHPQPILEQHSVQTVLDLQLC